MSKEMVYPHCCVMRFYEGADTPLVLKEDDYNILVISDDEEEKEKLIKKGFVTKDNRLFARFK